MSEKEKACETNWISCRTIVFPMDLVVKNHTGFRLIAKILPPIEEGQKERLFITSTMKNEWPGIEYPAYLNEFTYDKQMDDGQLLNAILRILQSDEVYHSFVDIASAWWIEYHDPDEETYYDKYGVLKFKSWENLEREYQTIFKNSNQ